MKTKEILVFLLLAASIVAAFGGFALVSRGDAQGWVGVAVAVPMLFVVQRAMRVVSAPTIDVIEKPARNEAPSAES
jgi:hypothetical protein